jgi:hypothetical protein
MPRLRICHKPSSSSTGSVWLRSIQFEVHDQPSPIFFDFNTDILFGNATPSLATPTQRVVRSNNVKQVTCYIKELHDLIENCNAFNRARQLRLPGNRHAFAERLDADMVQSSLAAEKCIKRYGEPAWSVALDQSRKKLSILRKCLSMLNTGLDMTRNSRQQCSLERTYLTAHHEC